MQLKAGVPLKGNLKSAECEENLREPEKPAHKSACNDWGKSSQTALKSAKLPQLLQLGAVTVQWQQAQAWYQLMPCRSAAFKPFQALRLKHAVMHSLTDSPGRAWHAHACFRPVTCIANCLSGPTVAETSSATITWQLCEVADGAVMGLSCGFEAV